MGVVRGTGNHFGSDQARRSCRLSAFARSQMGVAVRWRSCSKSLTLCTRLPHRRRVPRQFNTAI